MTPYSHTCHPFLFPSLKQTSLIDLTLCYQQGLSSWWIDVSRNHHQLSFHAKCKLLATYDPRGHQSVFPLLISYWKVNIQWVKSSKVIRMNGNLPSDLNKTYLCLKLLPSAQTFMQPTFDHPLSLMFERFWLNGNSMTSFSAQNGFLSFFSLAWLASLQLCWLSWMSHSLKRHLWYLLSPKRSQVPLPLHISYHHLIINFYFFTIPLSSTPRTCLHRADAQ